jgi:hypothetical protein
MITRQLHKELPQWVDLRMQQTYDELSQKYIVIVINGYKWVLYGIIE